MKRRSTVKKHGVLFNNGFKRIPNLRISALNHLLSVLIVFGSADILKALHNKWLKELKCHFLRKTALIHLKLRTDNDNRTTRIVNTLTEKVLSETALLTLKHIRKGSERSIAGTCYGTAASAVVNKGINSLLKHSLFVSDDDVGSI